MTFLQHFVNIYTHLYHLYTFILVTFYLDGKFLNFNFWIYMDIYYKIITNWRILNRCIVIGILKFWIFLSYIWIMSRKNNLIQIQIANNNNYPTVTAPVLAHGNPYALDQLWQIKKREEQDRTLWIISPETVNTVRKLRIQKWRKRGKKGVKMYQANSS